MCDPVTAAGLALSAGGSYMQSREQAKNQKRGQAAKEGAFRASMDRQDQYANESRAKLNPVVDNSSRQAFDANLADSTAQRSQAFDAGRDTNRDYSFAPSSTPKNVVIAANRAFDEKGAESKRDADALARLGGYGQVQFDQGLGRNAFARDFGNINSKATADQGMLGLDMNQAYNNSQKAGGVLPALMKLGGTGLSLYGAAGSPGMYGTVENAPSGTLPWNMPQGASYQPGLYDYYKQVGF